MSDPMRRRSVPESAGSGTRPVTREARRSGRVPLVLDVVFELEGGEPVRAVSQDISLGGMFIETPTPAPFGASVSVTILAPARGGALVLDGFVRWTSPEGMGIQFGLTGARETHALTELLADG